MSYGQSTLKVADALHVVGFPDIVRVSPRRLQILIASGFLNVEGAGMPILFRHLLAGVLTEIPRRGIVPCSVAVRRTGVANVLTGESEFWNAGECCPVPEDLILLETDTVKDYVARSSLAFFRRFGRQKDSFLLGFADRSYEIRAREGQGDALAAAVFASRLIVGTTNVFTTLTSDYFLPMPEIDRHHVATIRETNHRPQDWSGTEFLLTLRFAVGVGAPVEIGQPQRPDAGMDSSDIGI